MVSELQNVAIDCADAYELARFWSEVLDRPLLSCEVALDVTGVGECEGANGGIG